MRMRPILLLCLLAVPHAAAHATEKTEDGQWWITTGNQNEPVTTWVITGLDLIIREVGPDDTRVEREQELRAHESLLATIVSPSNETLDCSLRIQHGATNRYSCDAPYILTEPGQYHVRLVGGIDGSKVDASYPIAGPLPDYFERTFPATGLASLATLQEENEALRQRVADLEARMAAAEAGDTKTHDSPGAAPALLVAAFAATALLRRR